MSANATLLSDDINDFGLERPAKSQRASGSSGHSSAAADPAFRLFLLAKRNFIVAPDFPDLLVEISCARIGTRALVPITSNRVRDDINALLDTFTGGAPDAYLRKGDLEDLIEFLRAKAPALERPAFKRIAWFPDDQELWIDLARADNLCVRITAGGWTVEEPLHPLFVRFPAQRPLPLPETTDDGESAWRRILPPGIDDEDAKLLLGTVLSFFVPTNFAKSFAYSVLVLYGDAGSGKTSLARLIKQLVDPEILTTAGNPKSVEDLFVDAQQSHLLSFDNLNFIRHDLSNGFCRIVSGGAFSKRKLYTDAGRSILQAHNPVLLNGIVVDIPKQDLLDRSVHIRLRRITHYDPHASDRAEGLLPEVMGHICDLLVRVIRNFPNTTVENAPRLNLLAKIAAAAEPFGCDTPFVHLLRSSQREALLASRDNDLVIGELFDLLRRQSPWTGTYKELLAALCDQADDATKRASEWPGTPHKLARHMRDHSLLLQAQGIDFQNGRKTEHGRIVTVRRLTDPTQQGDLDIPF